MENKKRKCFVADKETELLIDRIMKITNYNSISDLIRQLVEREAIRLGIKSGRTEENINNVTDENLNDLANKISLAINVIKESDDKLYVILDCINNLMQFMEIGGEFKSAYDENAHGFIKMSEDNLKQEKYISQLNKY